MNLNELLSGYLSFTGRPVATLTATEYIEFYKLSALALNSGSSNVNVEKNTPVENVAPEVSVPINTTTNATDILSVDDHIVSNSVKEKAESIVDERDNTVAFPKGKEMSQEELKPTSKITESVSSRVPVNNQKPETKDKKEITAEQQANALAILRSVSG